MPRGARSFSPDRVSQVLAVVCISFPVLFLSCEENINPPVVEDQEFTIRENAPRGTIIGAVIAYDPDPGQNINFEIGQGNMEGAFSMDAASGILSVEDPGPIDYERHTGMVLEVIVSDDHPAEPKESSAQITILLEDINEFPPVMADQQFTIDENPLQGAIIGIIEATDPEPQQELTFRILSGNDDGAIALEPGTGSLTVEKPGAFDHGIRPQFLLSVQVRDVHLDSKADTATITILVADLPE